MQTEIARLPRAVGLGEVPESNDREILTSPAALCQLTNGKGNQQDNDMYRREQQRICIAKN